MVGCDAHACGSAGAGSHGAVHIPSYIHSPRTHGPNRSNVSHSLSSTEFSCQHSPLCLTDSPSLCVRVYPVFSTVRHLVSHSLYSCHTTCTPSRRTTSGVNSYCRYLFQTVYQHSHPLSPSLSKKQCSLSQSTVSTMPVHIPCYIHSLSSHPFVTCI